MKQDKKNRHEKTRIKGLKEKRAISLFESAIMICSIFAFAFIIAEAGNVLEIASAQAATIACCEKSVNGAWCYDSATESECNSSYQINPNALCSQTSFCKTGCCYDSKEGTCAKSVPSKLCSESNGTFFSGETNCNIQQCTAGCCIIGEGASYVTEQQCKKKADYYGLDYSTQVDFRSVSNELQCLAMAGMQDKGACVSEDSNGERTCSSKTRQECLGSTGTRAGYEFYNDMLCTASQLNTTCFPTQKTTCVEDKDEIYFIDSCGNTANIYDSSKASDTNYWAYLYEKNQSCGASSTNGNANSASCGNCDYLAGSKCKAYRSGVDTRPDYGSYVCRDLSCKDTFDGTDRSHGESWCLYDGSIGNGTDIVGSRHWRHSCIEGEEEVEACEDYRQEICAEEKTALDDSSMFSSAACVANEWRECLAYNEDSATAEDNCKANQHCFWQAVWDPGSDVSDGLVYTCLPQYPPGNYLLSGATASEASSSEIMCGLASQSVTVTEVKKCKFLGIFGSDWKCVANCVADEEGWTQAMNKWCTSLGDCGAYVNIAGEVTDDGYEIENGVKLSDSYLASLVQNIIPNPEVSGRLSSEGGGAQDDSGWTGAVGAMGSVALVIGSWQKIRTFVGISTRFGGALKGVWASPFAKGFVAAAAAYFAGQIIGKIFGLDSKTTNQLSYAGLATSIVLTSISAAGSTLTAGTAITAGASGMTLSVASTATIGSVPYAAGATIPVGTTVTTATTGTVTAGTGTTVTFSGPGTTLTSGMSFSAILFWAVVVMIVLAVIAKLAGCGDTREHAVEFTCKPWQQPSGGADCSKCNDELSADGLHTCSEYRCESLGAACKLKDNAGNPVCWWENQGDVASPLITPWQDALTEGYSYEDTNSCPSSCRNEIKSSSEDGCIPYNTPIQFGIKTDELASCKIDSEATNSFDDMQSSFSGGAYLQEHSTILSSPSSQSIAEEMANALAVEEGEEADEASEIVTILDLMAGQENRIYIRCQDYNGNYNIQELTFDFCVSAEPDRTAPWIMRTNPASGSGVAYGSNSKYVELFVNEPADCRWSNVDMDYDMMENNLSCETSVTQMQSDGTYKCAGTLPGISAGQDNLFYFRCKDHPYSLNESERNANTQGYEYILKGTSVMNITSTSPQGTIATGTEPNSVELNVKTTGGISNGNAVCSYMYRGLPIEFFTTGGTEHKQQLSLMGGNYSFDISCKDTADNIAAANINFSIDVDKTAPAVVRAYYDSGMLKIITNEDATCRYSTNATIKCGFSFDDTANSTAMSSINTKTHTASWAVDREYYIKCKDVFGNNPGNNVCNIVAKAVDLTP